MRRMTLLLGAVIILAFLMTACGGGGEADDEPVASEGDAVAGEELFLVCAGCHGTDAKGLPNSGKDMTTSAFIKGRSDDELVEFIKTGRPIDDPENTTGVDMPPKGGNPAFTDEELLNIVAYIRTLME